MGSRPDDARQVDKAEPGPAHRFLIAPLPGSDDLEQRGNTRALVPNVLLAMPVCLTLTVGCTPAAPDPAPPAASPTATPTTRALPVGDQPVDLVPADFTADITNP